MNLKRICILRAVFVLGAMLASGTRMPGQVSTASIHGTIRDSSGAAIPSASILLRNAATGVEQTSSSNGVGEYVIINL